MTTEEKAQVMLDSTKPGAVVEKQLIGAEWEVDYDPSWDWNTYNYRIKKQPRVVWLCQSSNGVLSNQPWVYECGKYEAKGYEWVKFEEAQ